MHQDGLSVMQAPNIATDIKTMAVAGLSNTGGRLHFGGVAAEREVKEEGLHKCGRIKAE